MFWEIYYNFFLNFKRRLKERNQEKCGFSIAISTNFAKILENVAQISDIQNWEEKKKKSDVLGNEKNKRRLKRMESGEMCVSSLL
jgi:hypothetical protein